MISCRWQAITDHSSHVVISIHLGRMCYKSQINNSYTAGDSIPLSRHPSVRSGDAAMMDKLFYTLPGHFLHGHQYVIRADTWASFCPVVDEFLKRLTFLQLFCPVWEVEMELGRFHSRNSSTIADQNVWDDFVKKTPDLPIRMTDHSINLTLVVVAIKIWPHIKWRGVCNDSAINAEFGFKFL